MFATLPRTETEILLTLADTFDDTSINNIVRLVKKELKGHKNCKATKAAIVGYINKATIEGLVEIKGDNLILTRLGRAWVSAYYAMGEKEFESLCEWNNGATILDAILANTETELASGKWEIA